MESNNNQLALSAVKRDCTHDLTELIREGADVNYIHQNTTLLHTAAKMGLMNVVTTLLESGADPNTVVPNGSPQKGTTALLAAVEQNDQECVKLLLNSGADVNADDSLGFTAAHKAIDIGSLDMLQLLFKRGHAIEQHSSEDVYNLYMYAVESIIEHPIRNQHQQIRDGLRDDQMVELLCRFTPHSHPTHFTELRDMTIWCGVWHGEYQIPAKLIKCGSCVHMRGCCRGEQENKFQTLLVDLIVAASNTNDLDIYHSCKFIKFIHEVGSSIAVEKFEVLCDRCKDSEFVELLQSLSPHLRRPRSLKDLCRIAIRESITRNMMSSVRTLLIPTSLQRYLVFSDTTIDDIVKREIRVQVVHYGI